MRRGLAVLLLLLALAPRLAAAHQMIDGAARAGLDSFAFTFNSPDSNFLGFGGVENHVYELYGYLGNATGVARVVPAFFDELVPIGGSGATASSQLVLNASGAALLGLAAGDIRLVYDFALDEAARSFLWDVELTNASAGPQDLTFYAYADFDLSGGATDDLADGGAGGFALVDSVSAFELLFGASVAADHWLVGAYPGVQSLLDSLQGVGAQDLGDSGTPFGPGDFTGALQFGFSLAPGGSGTLGLIAIPEPATVLLFAFGLSGLTIAGRRRRPD
jgi:hypothetical protein